MASGAVPSGKNDAASRTAQLDLWVERGFFGFVSLVYAYLCFFAGRKLLWFDESLSYYTESIPSAAALLRVQATTPVSLDPPLYHLLGHWMMGLGLPAAFAIRFPSLLGSLLMVVGIYVYTKRIAGFYPAAISVAGLILTYDFYLVEARPYGILLGATALSLLLWQNCIRGLRRRASLVGVFAVLGLAVSCHYFGILIAVPILLAELWRTVRRRRVDLPVVGALLGSYGFAAFWLPFMGGAKPYKAHYYVSANFMDCIRSYSWLDEIHRSVKGMSVAADTLVFLGMVATVVLGAYWSYKFGRRTASEWSLPGADFDSLPEEWAALVFVAIVPVFGGILAAAGAGSYLARYVLQSSIGLMVPRVSAILTFVRSSRVKTGILVVCAILIVAAFVRDQKRDRKDRELLRFSELQAEPGVLVVPDQYDDYMRLHFGDGNNGQPMLQYPFIADMERELAWKGTDNLSRTMENMRQFTKLPVMNYEELLQIRRPVVVIESKGNRHAWLLDQLRKDHAEITLKATQGDHSSYSVRMP